MELVEEEEVPGLGRSFLGPVPLTVPAALPLPGAGPPLVRPLALVPLGRPAPGA